jgi:hypothetical protein
MTNREMLSAIKGVIPLINYIKERAEIIINNTFDHDIQTVVDIAVSDIYVEIFYDYRTHNKWGRDCVKIPIEWFDEGFDYKSAYNKMLNHSKER